MQDPVPTDLKEIILKAKAGDREAFSFLYQAYFTPVYRYLYFRLSKKEDAEDLAQEVFIKAYGSFASYSYSGLDPLAYFYTIARNALIDRRRKRGLKLVDEDDAPEARDPSARRDEELMAEDDAKELRRQIAHLPKDQREVVLLRFIEERSTKETAELMGKKEEAVRKLQSRALRSLRETYKSHE